MKQMAKLAQAIAHGPKLIFLDEPTNGLDPAARLRMIKLIREIRETRDIHLIISSHLLRDVEECCEEVLILKDGQDRRQLRSREGAASESEFHRARNVSGTRVISRGDRRLGCDFADLGQGRFKMVLTET